MQRWSRELPENMDSNEMDKKQQWHAWYFVAAIFGVPLIAQLWALCQNVAAIPYSQFIDDLNGNKIAEVRVSGDYIEGEWKEAQTNGAKSFVTTRVPPQLADVLEKRHVKFSGQVQNTFLSTLLSWIIPTVLFFGIWMFWFRGVAQNQGGFGGLMSIGRSKAKVYVETDTKTTFNDVAGVDEAKEELKEIVEFLKHPAEYGRLGAHIPKGVLLIGPPGTGKTLARTRNCGRGWRAVFLDQRFRIRRNVRRRWRGARARPFRASATEGRSDHIHRRTRRDGAGPRHPIPTWATTRKSRRSTSC